MRRVAKLIKQAFSNHPIISNSVVYGTLYIGAEFSQQTLCRKVMQSGQPTAYDAYRITTFGILGVVFYPQVYYYWYRWLDNRFVGTSIKTVMKKLLLDQFLMTPPLLVIFYVAMSIMESKTDLLEECQQKIVPTFKTSCLFWLPAQTINFLLVPPALRVAYVGTCAFAWVNILCWFKRQEY